MIKQDEERYIKLITDNCFSDDIEVNHGYADSIIVELIGKLGYKRLARLYESVEKQYD